MISSSQHESRIGLLIFIIFESNSSCNTTTGNRLYQTVTAHLIILPWYNHHFQPLYPLSLEIRAKKVPTYFPCLGSFAGLFFYFSEVIGIELNYPPHDKEWLYRGEHNFAVRNDTDNIYEEL